MRSRHLASIGTTECDLSSRRRHRGTAYGTPANATHLTVAVAMQWYHIAAYKVDRREVDDDSTVAELAEVIRSGLKREAALADAAWAGQGEETEVRATKQFRNLAQFQLPADERRQGYGQGAARRI